MAWEIESKKESEENVQQGSRNGVDLTTGGEAPGGQGGKWKGREEPVRYCTWYLDPKRQDDQLDAPSTYTIYPRSPLSVSLIHLV